MKKIILPKGTIFFVVGLLLGVVVIQQIYLHKKVTSVSQPDETNALGFQISQLIKNNEKLTAELDQLTEERQKTLQSLNDRASTSGNIAETTDKYKIIDAVTAVEGQGVKISISNRLEVVQIVDLVNALRNIGEEAMSINGKRIGPKTGISEGRFGAPYEVLVIGDPEVLHSSLTRPGGIISQIGEKMEVAKVSSILVPALER